MYICICTFTYVLHIICNCVQEGKATDISRKNTTQNLKNCPNILCNSLYWIVCQEEEKPTDFVIEELVVFVELEKTAELDD